MTGYAPNSSAPEDDGPAPLTSGLLARKGQAMPAVDADAHEGVDINFAMHMTPANSAGKKPKIDENTIISLKRRAEKKKAAAKRSARIKIIRARKAKQNVIAAQSVALEEPDTVSPMGPEPDTWKLPTQKPAAVSAPVSPSLTALKPETLQKEGPTMATVKFKIPARDFIRMRAASRDLNLSGPSLIREALECYLEANDVGPVSDEDYAEEMERLRALVRQRKTGLA